VGRGDPAARRRCRFTLPSPGPIVPRNPAAGHPFFSFFPQKLVAGAPPPMANIPLIRAVPAEGALSGPR